MDTTENKSESAFQLPQEPGDKMNGLFSIFIPAKDFFVTPLIIDLNILHFLLMSFIGGAALFEPGTQVLINWGANYAPYTNSGQQWRLLTSVFEHIGLLHLLFNMYALIYVGIYLEPILGKIKFTFAYLLTGIVASYSSLVWHTVPVVAAGASGAIFGMYGVFLSLLTTKLIDKDSRKSLLISILVFVGYNLLGGLQGNIDNAAHVGGLVSGLVTGYVLYYFITKRNK